MPKLSQKLILTLAFFAAVLPVMAGEEQSKTYLPANSHTDKAAKSDGQLQHDANRISVLKASATQLKLKGKYYGALHDVDEALRLQPEDPDCLHLQAQLQMLTGKCSLAAAGYQKVLKLSPNRPDALGIHYELAAALAGCGDLEKALTEYTVVVHGQPDHLQALIDQGSCLRHLGRLDEALSAFEKASVLARKNPPNGQFYYERGSLWSAMHKPKLAIADYTESLRILGANTFVLQGRAEQYAATGKYSEALADVARWQKLEPKNLDCLVLKANLEDLAGEYARAVTDCKTFFKLSQDDPHALGMHITLASAYENSENFQQSLAQYNVVLSKEPDNPVALMGRGTSLLRLGKHDQGLEALQAALHITKDPVLREVLLNRIAAEHRNSEDFSAQYQDKLNLDTARVEQEIAKLDRLIKDGTTPPAELHDAYLRRAELNYDLEKYSRAVADLDYVLRINPGDSQAIALKTKASNYLNKRSKQGFSGGQ
jgi:tetratricopeptide (TPR) repeat protein